MLMPAHRILPASRTDAARSDHLAGLLRALLVVCMFFGFTLVSRLGYTTDRGLDDLVALRIGIVSIFVYTRAVALLGATGTALFTAAMPCITTLLAIPLLSEWPSVTAIIGVAVVTTSMVVAARSSAP